MRLTDEELLHAIVRTLREQISPALQDGFMRDELRMASNQLERIAKTVNTAVAVQVEENAQLRDLCRKGAAIVTDTALAERLLQASKTTDPSLRLDDLQAGAGHLRLTVQALHEYVDALDTESAQSLGREIWQVISNTECKRMQISVS